MMPPFSPRVNTFLAVKSVCVQNSLRLDEEFGKLSSPFPLVQ